MSKQAMLAGRMIQDAGRVASVLYHTEADSKLLKMDIDSAETVLSRIR